MAILSRDTTEKHLRYRLCESKSLNLVLSERAKNKKGQSHIEVTNDAAHSRVIVLNCVYLASYLSI